MRREIIQEAITKANKLGFRGIKVVDYVELASAASEDNLLLITTIPKVGAAADSNDSHD